MDEDVYFKKEVVLKHAGETLRFRVSQDLFSSFQVDVGTRFLLKTVAKDSHSFHKILDLGCGYGPIGLTLKKINNESEVHLVDRDALAVAYSRQNAELNQLDGVRVYGSLGYDDVPDTDFDLIIANIPGKAGEAVISHLLRDAACYLRPEGLVAIVVVSPLESTVEEILKHTPDVAIVFNKNHSGYEVFHYRFIGGNRTDSTPEKSLDRGIYDRDEAVFSFRDLDYRMRTARGLPEFDSLHYQTEFLLEAIQSVRTSTVRRAIVFNPGQGHVPVVLWKLIKPGRMVLVDRDLLSLRFSLKNLALNACPEGRVALAHQTGILANGEGPADLITGVLREDEGTEAMSRTLRQAADQLSPDGVVLTIASSTAVARLVKVVQSQNFLKISDRKKRRGYCLLALKSIRRNV